MYALKIITVKNDGNPVECVTALGDSYRLEFNPAVADSKVVARVHYAKDDNNPCIEINRGNEAFITTLDNKTVRVICRADKACETASVS